MFYERALGLLEGAPYSNHSRPHLNSLLHFQIAKVTFHRFFSAVLVVGIILFLRCRESPSSDKAVTDDEVYKIGIRSYSAT